MTALYGPTALLARERLAPPDGRLLAALEDELRRVGYRRAILDTGVKQPHAEALYRSAGYLDIENYRGPASRASFWGAKSL